MMRASFLPAKILRRFIDRYWYFDLSKKTKIDCLDIFPGTGADLLFSLKDPLIETLTNNNRVCLDNSHLICQREGRRKIRLGENTLIFAVRFRSWALCNFCGIPVSNLKDTFVPSSQIWGEHRITQLMEKLLLCRNELNVVKLFDEFLLEQLDVHYKNDESLFHAVDQIYYHCDDMSIRSLSDGCEISNRHLRRKFIEIVGVSPKRFQKIARFQHLMRHSMLNGRSPNLDDALRMGYFDQSHFIKDFSHFTDQSPGLFFNENLQKSHFYNNSITASDKMCFSKQSFEIL